MIDYITKRFIFALKIVIAICLVSVPVMVLAYGKVSVEMVKIQLFYNIYYGLTLGIVVPVFFDVLNRYYPWQEAPGERAIVGAIGSIVLTMLVVFILNFIYWVWYKGYDYSVLIAPRNRLFYIIALVISVIMTLVFHAYHFYDAMIQQTKINAELRERNLKTQLATMQAHIDPHFLFNSFNVLSGLIDEDKEKAQEFLNGLSLIYRRILEQRNEELSQLNEEITFAKEYLKLHSMRFEDSIFLDVHVPEVAYGKQIPALVLQLLLENAIKHNKFSAETPLKIDICQENGYLVVRNNKCKRNVRNTTRMGLRNIKERYALLTSKAFYIKDETYSFTVYLPLL